MTMKPPRSEQWVELRQPLSRADVDFILYLLHSARRDATKVGDPVEQKICDRLLEAFDNVREA